MTAGRNDFDAKLDRELAALLSVEPSPEFVARVRARVASEPVSTRASGAMVPAFLTLAAAAALAIGVFVWRSGDARPTGVASRAARLPAAAARVLPHAQPPATLESDAVQQARVAQSRRLHAALRNTAAPARSYEPEVLIDPREAQALRRVLILGSEGQLRVDDAQAKAIAAAFAARPPDVLVVSAIAINPIMSPDKGVGLEIPTSRNN
jgi:hypothetical protein